MPLINVVAEKYRRLTVFEYASRIDFAERDRIWESHIAATTRSISKNVNSELNKVAKQVQDKKIITNRKYKEVEKLKFSTKAIQQDMQNSFVYVQFEGRNHSATEVQNSLGKKIRFGVEDVSPEAAFKRFGKKTAVARAEFDAMEAAARTKAFTVAGIIREDVLRNVHRVTLIAIREGWTIPQYQAALREANVQYSGSLTRKNREGQLISPWHAETILRTNFAEVYADGRNDLFDDPDIVDFVPAFQYSAILDTRTRKTHRRMDERIYARDDPIWIIWDPPNGYCCRCNRVAVTMNMKYKVSSPIRILPDLGFRGVPVAVVPPAIKRAALSTAKMKLLEDTVEKELAKEELDLYEIGLLRRHILEDELDIPEEAIMDIATWTESWTLTNLGAGGQRLQVLINMIDRRGKRGLPPAIDPKIFDEITDDHLRAGFAWRAFNQKVFDVKTKGEGIVAYRGIQGSYARKIRDTAEAEGVSKITTDAYPIFSLSSDRTRAVKFVGSEKTMLKKRVMTSDVFDSHFSNAALFRDDEILCNAIKGCFVGSIEIEK